MQLLSFALRGGHILRIRVTMGSLIVHVGEEHCNRQGERGGGATMEELIGARTTNIWQTDGGGDEGAPPTKLHCATRSHPGTHPVHKMCSSPPASTFNLLQQIKSDIVGTPQALKPSISSTFWVGRIPFSHYWPSWVIRIGLPV